MLVMLDPEDATARLYVPEGRSIRRTPPAATVSAGGEAIARSQAASALRFMPHTGTRESSRFKADTSCAN